MAAKDVKFGGDAREKLQMRLATPDVTLYVGDDRAPARAASAASGAAP